MTGGTLSTLLAALTWDPQIRGGVIVLVSTVILCGSVYLILATNTGAKVGLLLTLAGLVGWTAAMGWVWVLYGIGIKGDPPAWHVTDVITGGVEQSTLEETEGFPNGWQQLKTGDTVLADAVASADKVLIPAEEGADAHGGGGSATGGGGAEGGEVSSERSFEPPFETTEDYIVVGGYRRGGEDFYIPGGLLERSSGFLKGWFHKPHYVVVQAAPVIAQPETGGTPPSPEADPTQPVTNVVMVRDLGNLRFPSFMVALSMTILFAVICNALHRRDKEIWAAKAAPAPAAG
ncbi:MAG TPA: hypothetical protein VFO65_07570 [Acidimicrobiales bacterium]|nr:hypothetical protein [Acidimicrobiales bacterium]